MAVSAYGNIRAGARILGETEDGHYIRAMGMCHDLERNVLIAMETQRRIIDKNGQRYNDDMIMTTANAAARSPYATHLPRRAQGSHQERLRRRRRGHQGSVKSLVESRQRAMEGLKSLSPSLTPERVCAALERPGGGDRVDDIVTLRGLYTAIKTGETSVEDAFPPLERAVKASDLLPPLPVRRRGEAEARPARKEAPRRRRTDLPRGARRLPRQGPGRGHLPRGRDGRGGVFFGVQDLEDLRADQEKALEDFRVAYSRDPSSFADGGGGRYDIPRLRPPDLPLGRARQDARRAPP